jgi:hypothetical protein
LPNIGAFSSDIKPVAGCYGLTVKVARNVPFKSITLTDSAFTTACGA